MTQPRDTARMVQADLFVPYNLVPDDRIPNKEKLRVDEVETILRCGRQHVYNLIFDGTLRAVNIARRDGFRPVYRVYTDSLRAFLATREEGADQ